MLRQTCCASAKSLVQVIQELACRVQVYQIDERIGSASVVRAHDDGRHLNPTWVAQSF